MTDSFDTNTALKGRYQIQERIGTGGMARVYRAHDVNLDRLVAIKILHDHLASDSTFEKRFVREAKFVASFNHPNIVQVYDFDVIDHPAGGQVYYMVMPYIPGPTLKGTLDKLADQGERLPYARVMAIFKDLCAALSYAHSQGMIHRDVKPANILFDEHGRAVLTDFGIARLTAGSTLTQEGATTGTPAYMSPEQVNGADVDSRSDIYAMGIILYEMLAGAVPFKADSAVSTMLKHVQAPVPRLSEHVPDVDPALEALILRALAKDPDDRFQTVDELARQLASVLEGKPTDPVPASPVLRAVSGSDSALILNDNRANQTLPQLVAHSPRLILGFGLGLVALIMVIALLIRSSPTQEIEVPSMTSDTGTYINLEFDPDSAANALWPLGQSGSITREVTADGFYRFRNDRPSIASTSMVETGEIYGNSRITLTGLLEAESQPAGAYGIVFRYVDAQNYYVFAVDGSQRYSIWVRADGQWHELREADETWTFDEAVQPRGAINKLVIMAQGTHLVGMVNGITLVDLEDGTLAEGKSGLYLATPTSGGASALIDSYMIETGDLGAPSMTADN